MRIGKFILFALLATIIGCSGSGSSSSDAGTSNTSSALGPIVADGGAFGQGQGGGGGNNVLCDPAWPQALDLKITAIISPWNYHLKPTGIDADVYTGVAKKGIPNVTRIQLDVSTNIQGATIASTMAIRFGLTKDIPPWDPLNPPLSYVTVTDSNCPWSGVDLCLETSNLTQPPSGTNLGFFADNSGLWDMVWGGFGNIFEYEETQAEACGDINIPGQGMVAVRSNRVTFTIIPEDVP